MTRREYTAQVLENLRRVTRKEREAIEAEIDAHMEDHICDLLDLGYSPELAEERTMSFMGDPAEVGRELDKQYPLRWLVVKWVARFVAIWMLVFLISMPEDMALSEAWQLRVRPRVRDIDRETAELLRIEGSELLDIRLPMGNDEVRLTQITVEWSSHMGGWSARVDAGCYDKNPIGIAAGPDMVLENQRGERSETIAIAQNPWYHFYSIQVPVELEDTYVTVSFTQLGETVSCQVPLPKEINP